MTHGSLPAGGAQSWVRSGHGAAQAPVTPRARQTATTPPVAARCRASIVPAAEQRACRECVEGSGVGGDFPSRECRDRARLHPAPDVGAGLSRPSGSTCSTRGLLIHGRDVDLRCSAGYDPENQRADLRIERGPLALQHLLHHVLMVTAPPSESRPAPLFARIEPVDVKAPAGAYSSMSPPPAAELASISNPSPSVKSAVEVSTMTCAPVLSPGARIFAPAWRTMPLALSVSMPWPAMESVLLAATTSRRPWRSSVSPDWTEQSSEMVQSPVPSVQSCVPVPAQGAASAVDVAPASASRATASSTRASVGIVGLEHGPVPAVKGNMPPGDSRRCALRTSLSRGRGQVLSRRPRRR